MLDFKITTVVVFVIFILGHWVGCAQVNWMSFEQLDDSLSVKPKKVFIDFYADWCSYCAKMDRVVYRDPAVIAELNVNYYSVKMNAEYEKQIEFGGQIFTNKQLKHNRNPIHEIALVLGSRPEREFSLPLVIILDEKFNIVERYFEYLSPKKMKAILKI